MKGSFEYAFPKVVSVEGGLSTDPEDNGNWTGGRKGVGTLRGTKYGISAKAYPQEDIANLTFSRARTLYKDYWNAIRGDDLPDPLSHLVFDAAVNQGVSAATHMLQTALKVAVDGKMGPNTIAAATASDNHVCARFMTLRALRYMGTINSQRYLEGWLNRLFLVSMWLK